VEPLGQSAPASAAPEPSPAAANAAEDAGETRVEDERVVWRGRERVNGNENGDENGSGNDETDEEGMWGCGAAAATARKRRSRWGDKIETPVPPPQQLQLPALPNNEVNAATASNGTNGEVDSKKKKSRWGEAPLSMGGGFGGPGVLPVLGLQLNMTDQQREIFQSKLQIDAINAKLLNLTADIANDNPEARSPSPEPVYGVDGKRVNTREARRRDRYMRDRELLMLKLIKIDPTYRPPPGIKLNTKLFKKLHIPVEKYPEYNFMGLIIGPRGNTQKRLEKETGARIAIRGKGSTKAGKVRKDGKPQDDENEPMHVYISADTQESLDKAVTIVEQLLVPVEVRPLGFFN